MRSFDMRIQRWYAGKNARICRAREERSVARSRVGVLVQAYRIRMNDPFLAPAPARRLRYISVSTSVARSP